VKEHQELTEGRAIERIKILQDDTTDQLNVLLIVPKGDKEKREIKKVLSNDMGM
jgi:hypothetical protein